MALELQAANAFARGRAKYFAPSFKRGGGFPQAGDPRGQAAGPFPYRCPISANLSPLSFQAGRNAAQGHPACAKATFQSQSILFARTTPDAQRTLWGNLPNILFLLLLSV